MSFQQGLSGLNAASKALDAIGNNISNSSTVGFKAAQVQFADAFAASLSAGASSQVGIGTTVDKVKQAFTQGNIESTNNPLDVAINGQGFFRMSHEGAISYTRNGQFLIDKSNYLVNGQGYRLTGYAVATDGTIIDSEPVELLINKSDLPPIATTEATLGFNVDATEDVIGGAIDITDPATYNAATSMTVYDTLGYAHTVTFYFNKAAANDWDIAVGLDGTDITATVVAPGTNLVFGDDGLIDTSIVGNGTVGFTTTTVAAATGAQELTISVDMTDATQYGSAFGVSTLTQDGYASGRLTGVNIGSDGIMQGRYSNGLSRTLGQIVLYTFANPEGLEAGGSNQWIQTSASGEALRGTPGDGSRGVLQASAVEQSNVDLTAELVSMITSQRAYQANAQSIKTQDQVMQTLVNLR